MFLIVLFVCIAFFVLPELIPAIWKVLWGHAQGGPSKEATFFVLLIGSAFAACLYISSSFL